MKKPSSLAFIQTGNEVAPPPESAGPQPDTTELDRLRAMGYPVKDLEPINIKMLPQDFYNLLKMLEDRAIAATNYYECRQAVLFSEYLRAQASKQGR